MSKKLLTICITSYENFPHIKYSINNILKDIQDNPEIQKCVDFYLYDDNSSQEIKNLLKKYDFFKKTYLSKENFGAPSKGRNYGLDLADTKYILYLDGDDSIICPLMDLINKIKDMEADLIVSEPIKINSKGEKTKRNIIYQNKLFESSSEEFENNKQKWVVHQMGLWNIFNVDFLRKNNLRFAEDMRHEDSFLLTQVYLRNPNVKRLTGIQYYGWLTNHGGFTRSDSLIKTRIELYRRTLVEISQMEKECIYTPYILYSIFNRSYEAMFKNFPVLDSNGRKEYFYNLKKVEKGYEDLILENKIGVSSVSLIFKLSKYNIFDNFLFFKYFSKCKNFITDIFGYFFRASKKVIKIINKLICKVILKFILLNKIENDKVYIDNYDGKSFDDNGKYLYLQLQNFKEVGKVVMPINYKLCNKRGKDFFNANNKFKKDYHFNTSKTIYFTHWNLQLTKRNGQKWIYIGNGIPFKKINKDMHTYEQSIGSAKKEKYSKFIENIDEVWAPDKKSSKILSALFFNSNVVIKKYPKTEWLVKHKNDKKLKSEIIDKYKLSKEKYVLYAPTFRMYEHEIDYDKLHTLFKRDETPIIHLHRDDVFNTFRDNRFKYFEDIDVQELILVTERLITDYSSIAYDYLILDKKVTYYQPDLEKYEDFCGLYYNPLSRKDNL